jgi:hypothetical protein
MTDKVVDETRYRMLVLPGFDAVLSNRDKAIGQNTSHAGSNNSARRRQQTCGAKCYTAHGVDCTCVCRGINHGRGAGDKPTA